MVEWILSGEISSMTIRFLTAIFLYFVKDSYLNVLSNYQLPSYRKDTEKPPFCWEKENFVGIYRVFQLFLNSSFAIHNRKCCYQYVTTDQNMYDPDKSYVLRS